MDLLKGLFWEGPYKFDEMYVIIVCSWGLISVGSRIVLKWPNNSLVGVVYCAYFVS